MFEVILACNRSADLVNNTCWRPNNQALEEAEPKVVETGEPIEAFLRKQQHPVQFPPFKLGLQQGTSPCKLVVRKVKH